MRRDGTWGSNGGISLRWSNKKKDGYRAERDVNWWMFLDHLEVLCWLSLFSGQTRICQLRLRLREEESGNYRWEKRYKWHSECSIWKLINSSQNWPVYMYFFTPEIEINGMKMIVGLHNNAGITLIHITYNIQLYKLDAWHMLWSSTQNQLLQGMRWEKSLPLSL